ncbi:hypothetical protein YK48G_10040 [Lentilactobacillus fungorum]|uniref:D-alanyl-D-alanine carboxypeptidase n=1 Tax=Lentilactobacillus fungorum TaxID=2201250 RepID=A0ABQ3W0A7_9LACO|nr:hypothetical protein [Lentilactobacillus fungorum]GHP13579.1 hypothetical protein YK48G_10040 [Lentilactobacillus fungorum]
MKKRWFTLSLLIAFGLVGLSLDQVSAHAASPYKVTKTKYYTDSRPFHLTNFKKNVYAWNLNHTRKLYNLRNYPNTSWHLSRSVILTKNNKKSVYYYVGAATPNGKSNAQGYVWRGYLKAGYNPNYKVWNNLDITGFLNDEDYQNYLNQSPSQSLTRQVLNLFPNTALSLNLSKVVANGPDDSKYRQEFTNIFTDKKVNDSFYHSYSNQTTDQQKLTAIKRALDEAGYTTQKRESLTGYKIGIYYEQTKSSVYSGEKFAGLMLAKEK